MIVFDLETYSGKKLFYTQRGCLLLVKVVGFAIVKISKKKFETITKKNVRLIGSSIENQRHCAKKIFSFIIGKKL